MAVMGMFTGIIMTFSGGFTLLGSAFSEIDSPSFSRLAFLTALVGAILFNVIFAIFYFTGKISQKPIHTRCQYTKLNKCDDCKEYCSFPSKVWRKYPYLILMNGIFLALMVLSVLWSDSFRNMFQWALSCLHFV